MTSLNSSNTVKYLRLLYPMWVLAGIFSLLYIPSTLIDYKSAEITARNIADNTLLFRLGIAGSIITQLLFVLIPLLLYRLFKDVDEFLASLMVILGWISIPMTLYNETNSLIALGYLGDPNQMFDFIQTHSTNMIIPMIFWGLWLFPLGALIIKSNYFPKIIGWLVILAGLGYILGSFASIIFPNANTVNSVGEALTFGEVIFALWIVIRGVKNQNGISSNELIKQKTT